MVPAVTRILQAIETGETICVYGDFDAEASPRLRCRDRASGRRRWGRSPTFPIVSTKAMASTWGPLSASAGKAGLMVTVDCGIRSVLEVQKAVELSLDVIVTDHHSVGPRLPSASGCHQSTTQRLC